MVEEAPGVAFRAAGLLESAGHHVIRCGAGGPPHPACPLLRDGDCGLVCGADLIVFSCPLFLPLPWRTYTGFDIFHAYRTHPRYGRLPMVVVAVGDPGETEGAGRIEVLAPGTEPEDLVRVVDRLLAMPEGQLHADVRPPLPSGGGAPFVRMCPQISPRSDRARTSRQQVYGGFK